jgi:hypothetical protein
MKNVTYQIGQKISITGYDHDFEVVIGDLYSIKEDLNFLKDLNNFTDIITTRMYCNNTICFLGIEYSNVVKTKMFKCLIGKNIVFRASFQEDWLEPLC